MKKPIQLLAAVSIPHRPHAQAVVKDSSHYWQGFTIRPEALSVEIGAFVNCTCDYELYYDLRDSTGRSVGNGDTLFTYPPATVRYDTVAGSCRRRDTR